MATEILGFLIIVGILIVFIVRRDLWNGTSIKADEVEEASVKMRLQMEHSANAIITQMDSRIHQLEGLVSAADERARMLEQQMASVRADQERAQQQAEKAFAEMRAARASYYSPQEEMTVPTYHDDMRRGSAWPARDGYRARDAATRRSLRPIEGVSPVRRSEYVSRVRPEAHGAGEDFAETLSASMYAAEARNDAYRRPQAGYYDNGQPPVYEQAYPRNGRYPQDAVYSHEEPYDAREYGENYETASYPAETYPEEETWEQYVEQPRHSALPQRNLRAQRAQTVPVEMAVEETPAVIVDSQMVLRPDVYAQEEPEEEGAAFSPEQLEELARTEAEVVVSSSVADVVDLPMASDEEERTHDVSEDEDVHAFAEKDVSDEDELIAASPDEEPELPEEDESSEISQAGRFEEQTPEILFAEPEKEYPETGEDLADESEPFVAEDTIPAETAEENISSDPETEEGDMSAEASVDAEEMLAGGMNETVEEEDYDRSGNMTSGGREEDVSPRPPSPTIRAREMLAQGMSPEEVARETGMGRRAVELLAQMAQGKLNPQDDD